MLPWNCEGPVCWKSGSCRRWAYNSTPETFRKSHLTNVLNLCQGPGGLFSFTKNSTRFPVPRMSKNTLTILLGRKGVCLCQVPHRQTHGIKSNWPLLLLITNWTKLSNLTPGLEAVPAPLWATHNLPQNQSKRARPPRLSLHQHTKHIPERCNGALQTLSSSTVFTPPLQKLKKIMFFWLIPGLWIKKIFCYVNNATVFCVEAQKLRLKIHYALKYIAAISDAS